MPSPTDTIARAGITCKGRELSDDLSEHIGTTRMILKTCSLICRHATTHHRYMEQDWRGGWDERLERRIELLEARIETLVAALPATDDGPFRVEFWGDPRGCTVKLYAPGLRDAIGVSIR